MDASTRAHAVGDLSGPATTMPTRLGTALRAATGISEPEGQDSTVSSHMMLPVCVRAKTDAPVSLTLGKGHVCQANRKSSGSLKGSVNAATSGERLRRFDQRAAAVRTSPWQRALGIETSKRFFRPLARPIDGQRPLKVRDGLVMAAKRLIDRPPRGEGHGGPRIDADCLLDVAHRFGELVALEQGVGAGCQDLCAIRLETQSLVVIGQGAGIIAAIEKRLTAEAVKVLIS